MSNQDALMAFRWILRTFPQKFRKRFAQEMEEVFQQQLTDQPYTFTQQMLIHKTLLNLAGQSLRANFNLFLGLGLLVSGLYNTAVMMVGYPQIGDYSLGERLTPIFITTFSLLAAFNGLLIVTSSKYASKVWSSMIFATSVTGMIYLVLAVFLFTERKNLDFPIGFGEVIFILLFMTLPLALSILIGRYLRWREKELA